MALITVADSAGLNAAFALAQAGDTIALMPGTYAGVLAQGVHYAQDVTVTSVDTLQRATITDLFVNKASGLIFSNLEFQANQAFGSNAFKVTSGDDIHFDHLNVHGSLDNTPQNDVVAFLIRESSNVSVTNSEFQQLLDAVAHLNDTNLTISNNTFHDLQIDAIRGGGSSYVTVTGNTFRDFFPKDGDHGDAIQFWTTNTTTSAHDITVTNNLFLRGAGQVAQGIFFRDEVGGLPFVNVTIANNTMIGTMYNGIEVDGGRKVDIEHNIVVGFTDMKSWIRLENTDGATVSHNSASTYITTDTDKNMVMSDNATTPLASDGGAAAFAAWQAANSAATQLIGGTGNDILHATLGISYLRGMDGDDSISGGAAFDDINGNQGNDTAHGLGGDDWVVGGKGDDVLFGDDGDDQVLGNLGNDTLDGGAGADIVRGGQGDDVLQGGAGNDFVSGDRGNDTESGGAGADTFHSSSGAGIDRVLDFHHSEGDRVMLDPGTAYTLRQVGADTVVDMGSGDQLILVGVSLSSLGGGWITN